MKQTSFTGRGITAAVLDTGIYPHIDFDDRIVGFRDFISYRTGAYDDNGHGTHVSGILAGSGRASNGKYRGMAPDCRLVSLKVLDRQGNGSRDTVLHAFRWIRDHYLRYQIRVVNISVGTTYRNAGNQSLLVEGVERLWDLGLVVVAAAGNDGPRFGSVTAPGCSRKIITVGSSDMLDGRTAISGRGPTKDCIFKPDLVAEGRRVVSCSASGDHLYEMKSGTSMSTPVVAGAIACFLEKHPEASNVEVKIALKHSCEDLGFPKNIQGWGRFHQERFLAQ